MRRTLGEGHLVEGSRGAVDNRIGGLAAFLAIAFGLAWTVWVAGLSVAGFSGTSLLSFSAQAVVLVGALAPAVAAFIVRHWITREGFADARLRPNLRRGWRCYLLALLWPVVAVASVVGLATFLGLAQPDFSLGGFSGGLSPAQGGEVPAADVATAVAALLLSAVLMTPLLFGEEFGWRGYLQRRVFPGRPLLAAFATGFVWGAWHYPLVLFGYGSFSAGRLTGLLVYPVICVLLSVFYGWLMEKTESVWAPSLAHSAHNNVAVVLLLLMFAGGPGFSAAIWLVVVPYAALCSWIVLAGRLESGRPQVET